VEKKERGISNIFSIGSEWRKWDLHIHTPSSIIQRYGGEEKWEEFISALEHLPPEVKVIGINDYYFIDGFERVMRYRKQGRLSNIEKIFSVLEFRIDTFGSGHENDLQKINLHIIFDINEADLDNELRQIKTEFIGLIPVTRLAQHETKMLSHETLTIEGGNDLKNGFSNLIPPTDAVFKLLNSKTWKDKYFLLLGYKEWSNLEKNNQLKPFKKDLYDKVSAFFTSNHETHSKSKTWLNEYGNKALLHSCDIHDFSILDTNKKDETGKLLEHTNYCCNTWIKADPTFDGLRQIIYEPQNRVFIENENPDSYRENCINSITVDEDWFPQRTLPLNKGLVSIIGARGSGKTALLDFIALGSGAYNMGKAGFLYKAQDVLKSLAAKISIDGDEKTQIFGKNYTMPEFQFVKYLSQQFVENRCSENGSTELLQSDIEYFIFENIDDVNRLGTSNFSELREALFQHYESIIYSYKKKILDLNKEVSNIYRLQNIELPIKKKELDKKKLELKELERKLPELEKEKQNKSIDENKTTNEKKLQLESELKKEHSQIKEFEQINEEIVDFNKTILERNRYFREKLISLGINENTIPEFNIQYPISLTEYLFSLISDKKNKFTERYGDSKSPTEGTYQFLKNKLIEIEKEISTFSEKEKYHLDISKKINQANISINELDKQIKDIEDIDIKKLQKERVNAYQQMFGIILKEKIVLEKLYEPLLNKLENNEPLGFYVKINVDLKTWISKGEKLIDFRKTKILSEHNKLYDFAKEKLLSSWENCNPELIGKEIEDFTSSNEVREMSRCLIESVTFNDLADWLFSIDHISISYELTFDGKPLKLLSPGTKGILLMMLYLEVDKNDTRPLLIDQPEDNLDPETVYEILTPYFKKAKKRRQIIMVTHNPNLVVATDSDQVIIATSKPEDVNKLPVFTYYGGGLENPEIVAKICKILEGGKDAFQKREERYLHLTEIYNA
jgi:predicted ATPase